MPLLNVAAVPIGGPYPVPAGLGTLDLVIAVSDSMGQPVLSLHESAFQFTLAWTPNQIVVPPVVYSEVAPVLDDNGDPVMEPNEFGGVTPATQLVPGAARTAGLPGYYLMTLLLGRHAPGPGNVRVRVPAEIVVGNGGDRGQTLAPLDLMLTA